MNCNCCCTKTLDFCDQDVCGELDLDIKAQLPGVHTLVVHFLNVQYSLQSDLQVDENIVFSLEGLNENYTYTATLFDPNGKQILIKKSGVEYDCFTFHTQLHFTLNLVSDGSAV